MCEGDLKVDGIAWSSGLDDIVLEDGILGKKEFSPDITLAGAPVRLTMERTLGFHC